MRELTEEEAYQVAAFVEKFVVGMARLGSHYSDDEDLAWGLRYMLTPKRWKEAAQVRRILSSKYNSEIPEGEDQEELEKLFESLAYWKVPTPKQLARFRQNRLNKQG